jgi:predicted deacylase
MIKTLFINKQEILPGTITRIELPVAKLYVNVDISMPVHVIRGLKAGPTVFISAAVHGNEINGIEIIRRFIQLKTLKITHGTVILVPMVNVYGVLNQSRYMPDRRDLNRVFPGSSKGSLAGRLANIFLNEIVSQCDYGIDLHTAAIHRSNLPQIRADLNDEEAQKMAEAFGVPVLLNAAVLDGSLRKAAVDVKTKVLLYEAGEALRFDEGCIKAGLTGVINVLSYLGMTRRRMRKRAVKPFVAFSSSWLRAGSSGIVHDLKNLGEKVSKGDVVAEIGDSFGEISDKVCAKSDGIIIGKQNIPLVQEGDAMFHIAYYKNDEEDEVADHIGLDDILLPLD